MASKCDITNKKPMTGNSRSNALNATKRRQMPNLHYVYIEQNGKKIRVKMSAKAIRTLKNKKKI